MRRHVILTVLLVAAGLFGPGHADRARTRWDERVDGELRRAYLDKVPASLERGNRACRQTWDSG